MSKDTIRQLIHELEPLLEHDNHGHHEVDVIAQILLTIRFYATGCFYVTVGDFAGIHKTTAGRIIKRVTEAIISLGLRYIKFSNDDEGKNRMQLDFYQFAYFPKVIGAIDCTHIPIQSPGGNNAEIYRNRKGTFSLNVQAVCNAKNYIMDLVPMAWLMPW